jgi:hypothetical protein
MSAKSTAFLIVIIRIFFLSFCPSKFRDITSDLLRWSLFIVELGTIKSELLTASSKNHESICKKNIRSHGSENSYISLLDRDFSVDQTVTISENRGSVPGNVCAHPTWHSTLL